MDVIEVVVNQARSHYFEFDQIRQYHQYEGRGNRLQRGAAAAAREARRCVRRHHDDARCFCARLPATSSIATLTSSGMFAPFALII